jgi:hypothetical protein
LTLLIAEPHTAILVWSFDVEEGGLFWLVFHNLSATDCQLRWEAPVASSLVAQQIESEVFLLEPSLHLEVDTACRFLRQSLLATPLGAITSKAPWLRPRGLLFEAAR